MWQYFRMAMRYVERFDTQDWLLVFLIAVGIGAFCMRGFGSRASY